MTIGAYFEAMSHSSKSTTDCPKKEKNQSFVMAWSKSGPKTST